MRRTVRLALFALSSLAVILLPQTALLSQTSKAWSQCIGREGPIADLVIEGCGAIIEAGQGTPAQLGLAFNNRGVAYRLKGEYDHALDDYNEAIRLNPTSASHYNNRGIIFRIKQEYDRAIEDYDRAIFLRRDYPAAFYNRAIAYSRKGDKRRALLDFDVVLQFNAKNALALYARAQVKLEEGDTTGANADIAAATAINPNVADEYKKF